MASPRSAPAASWPPGKPKAALLTNADATVTIAQSRTQDLPSECRRADILIAATGRPEMVRGDWIKPGAAVIDVGINRLPDGRLVGEGSERGELIFEAGANAQARFDIERADGAAR